MVCAAKRIRSPHLKPLPSIPADLRRLILSDREPTPRQQQRMELAVYAVGRQIQLAAFHRRVDSGAE